MSDIHPAAYNWKSVMDRDLKRCDSIAYIDRLLSKTLDLKLRDEFEILKRLIRIDLYPHEFIVEYIRSALDRYGEIGDHDQMMQSKAEDDLDVMDDQRSMARDQFGGDL